MSNELTFLVNKMKKHRREVLLPIYKEHSKYLLRVIKTLNEKDEDFNLAKFTSKLETFKDVGTCHEIALNEYSSLDLETHQNSRGKEREYTAHPKAKGVRRDLRVKIIWQLVIDEIDNLDSYKAYENLYEIKNLKCPLCNEIIVTYEKINYGCHADGSINWAWQVDETNVCNCIVFIDNDYQNNFYDDEIEFFYDLKKEFSIFEDIFAKLDGTKYLTVFEDANEYYYATEDLDALINKLSEVIEEIIKEEGEEDWLEYIQEFCENYYVPISLREVFKIGTQGL